MESLNGSAATSTSTTARPIDQETKPVACLPAAERPSVVDLHVQKRCIVTVAGKLDRVVGRASDDLELGLSGQKRRRYRPGAPAQGPGYDTDQRRGS